MSNFAALVDRAHPSADKIRPREIVAEIQNTLAAELEPSPLRSALEAMAARQKRDLRSRG